MKACYSVYSYMFLTNRNINPKHYSCHLSIVVSITSDLNKAQKKLFGYGRKFVAVVRSYDLDNNNNLCDIAICLFSLGNFFQIRASLHNTFSQVKEISIQTRSTRLKKRRAKGIMKEPKDFR